MIHNFLTEDTKAIILLCGVFGKNNTEKPLSLAEYSLLVRWLIEEKIRPSDLLQKEARVAASWGTGIDKQRLESLIGRGVQLGFAVEEWQQNGIWIISRSDADYPARYKKHLKDKAPPLLFGAGNRSLLHGGGLGIVGSRNVDQAGEAFTRHVAQLCAYNRMPVVSGGARGVDQIAINTVLEADGVAISILAENLLKKSIERNARQAIAEKRLLLLSPYHPTARFSVGSAMGRNKLIYALSDYGLVVSAEYKKGGTWAGAEEELKRENALSVFVRVGSDVPHGNNKLLPLGAIPWPDSIDRNNFKQQLYYITENSRNKPSKNNLNFPDDLALQEASSVNKPSFATKIVGEKQKISEQECVMHPECTPSDYPTSIYQLVLPVLLHTLDSPATADELAVTLDVTKTQLNAWLKKGVADNKIIKLSNPLRYQRAVSGIQVSLWQ